MFMTGYSRGQEGVYVAEAGEDLLRIAGARGVPVGLLEELNPGVGRRDSLQTGQAVAVPSPHRHRGTVVAVSNRQAGPCLVAIDVCSGEVRVLEAGACAWSSVPVLSPDGDRVAYQGPDGRVAVLSTDGGSPVPIGRSPSGFVSPKWSPTGELLAWDSDGVTEVLSASGELVARIEGACPSWMGRGRSIAVIRDGRAVLVDLGDGTSVQLEAVLRPQDQVWAVHGATMGSVYACVATENGQLRLEVHDWFTGDRAGVDVGSDLWPWSIKWSPDCTMLAAQSGTQMGMESAVTVTFYQVDAAGPEIRPVDSVTLVSDPRYAGLSWSHSSDAVALSARVAGGGAYAVHIVELLGGVHRITGRGDSVLPDWGPSR